MEENEVIEPSKTKYNRQPPSIPFLWEERPGVAKKDWRPVVSSVTLALPSPEKLVASVPFNWKEKPGKPLSCFSQPSIDSALTAWKASQQHNDYNFDNKESGGNDNHRHKGTFDLDLESFSFETDDSFSSAPSLLANCRVLSSAVSTAVPVLKTSSKIDINDQLEIPSSSASESDSSASSYETDISSLTGASFLECLFPLYPPNSGFPGKVEYSNNGSHTPLELKKKHFDHESCSNAMAKRPPTLGELIMMSRGRSCQRKVDRICHYQEFINGKAFACCVFGAGIKMIGGLQTKRHHPKLKLI